MLLAMMPRVTGLALTFVLPLLTLTLAQTIFPSNNSNDLFPVATSPRFLLNGTEFPRLPAIHLAPLGQYAQIDHTTFLSIQATGHLANVDASNANVAGPGSTPQFSYISCDPSAYTGNLNANDVFRIAVNQAESTVVILYSETSDHCGASGLNDLPSINGVLTTTDPTLATMLAKLNLNFESNGDALILPDLNSYTNGTDGSTFDNNNGLGSSPTTAVAMIILYSITGIITALFVVIIVTGAVRAHRHPERYGPRNIMGRGRQSRARGIARAMLETLPIVKFGDREDVGSGEQQKPPHPQLENDTQRDIEMNPSTTLQPSTETEPDSKAVPIAATGASLVTTDQPSTETPPSAINNADGTDDMGHLGCSICTEDFTKGEEVRVLPCNHKFHPDCVDPWLLNVSGTCPLCRIDLQPRGEDEMGQDGSGAAAATTADGGLATATAPPLGAAGAGNEAGVAGTGEEGRRRRDTFASLRQMANLGVGSREERIAALRRLRMERQERQERRNRQGAAAAPRGESAARLGGQETRVRQDGGGGDAEAAEEEERERRGLARRFRERFRIRTVRNA